MALRIRRGTDAQRAGITFDQGELVYTTNTQKLYVGDGITSGGNNILATSAGVGLTWNASTQQLDFTTQNLGLTTSVVSEGANKYFTAQRAQDAAAALFTAAGAPVATGTISGTVGPATVTVSSISGLTAGEPFVVSGSGGNGLTAGTYYVISANGNSAILASTQANATAQTPVPLTTLTTGSISGTTFSAGGPDSGITFVYDSVNHVMNISTSTTLPSLTGQTGKYLTNNGTTTSWATLVPGITSVSADTNPHLGGSLTLSGYNITGSGNLSFTGNVVNTGNVTTTGNISATGTISNGVLTMTSGALTTINSQLDIGSVNTATTLNIYSNSSTAPALQLTGLTAGTTTLGQEFKTSRGTISSPTVVQTGDALQFTSSWGYDGSNYIQTSISGSFIDPNGTVSSNAVPGMIGLLTFKDTNAANYKGVFINSLGYVTVNRSISYNPKAAMDINGVMLLAPQSAAPGTLVEGMIAIANRVNWDPASKGTGGSYPVYYNGTSWVAFY